MATTGQMPRRAFLARLTDLGRLALAGLFSTSLSTRAALGAKPPGQRPSSTIGGVGLDVVTCEDFAPYQGGSFLLRSPTGARVTLRLLSGRKLRKQPIDAPGVATRIPFSLHFRGPDGARWPQDTYLVSNRDLGSFSLFIVPIGPSVGQPIYEAIFS